MIVLKIIFIWELSIIFGLILAWHLWFETLRFPRICGCLETRGFLIVDLTTKVTTLTAFTLEFGRFWGDLIWLPFFGSKGRSVDKRFTFFNLDLNIRALRIIFIIYIFIKIIKFLVYRNLLPLIWINHFFLLQSCLLRRVDKFSEFGLWFFRDIRFPFSRVGLNLMIRNFILFFLQVARNLLFRFKFCQRFSILSWRCHNQFIFRSEASNSFILLNLPRRLNLFQLIVDKLKALMIVRFNLIWLEVPLTIFWNFRHPFLSYPFSVHQYLNLLQFIQFDFILLL